MYRCGAVGDRAASALAASAAILRSPSMWSTAFWSPATRAARHAAETILSSQERKTLTQFYPNDHRPLTFACHNPLGVRRYGAGRSCGPVPPPASPQSATNNAIRRATIMSASRAASLLVACAAATAVLAGSAVPVQAEERTCRGSIGAVTVDNLRVPQAGTCKLSGTRVKGTIKVERAATLDARQGGGDRQRPGRRCEVGAGARRLAGRRLDPGEAGRRCRRGQQHRRRQHPARVEPGAAARPQHHRRRRRAGVPELAAGSRSATTRSTAICSASRTTRHPPATATTCRATRRISAAGSEPARPRRP